jgi:DNA-binding NtrC family response regulator
MKSCVLIVENERATAWALSQGLAEDGYRIKAVKSSEEALKFLRRGRCDLIITDVRLPGMSGIELLKKIASKKKIPAIVITASGSHEVHSEAKRAGAVKLFPKPFKLDEVRKTVARTLPLGSSGRGGRRAAAPRAKR